MNIERTVQRMHSFFNNSFCFFVHALLDGKWTEFIFDEVFHVQLFAHEFFAILQKIIIMGDKKILITKIRRSIEISSNFSSHRCTMHTNREIAKSEWKMKQNKHHGVKIDSFLVWWRILPLLQLSHSKCLKVKNPLHYFGIHRKITIHLNWKRIKNWNLQWIKAHNVVIDLFLE